MQRAIEKKLKEVLGLPLWGIGRAGSLLWLQIGARQVVATRNGGSKEVGTFALHIDCPWSWTRNHKVIANQGSDLDSLTKLVSVSVICQNIRARDNGSFELDFDNNTKLVVSVEVDADQHRSEYWRYFEPNVDAPHFVVGERGIHP